MTVTVRLRASDAAGVTFGISALAELGAALHVLAEPDHHGSLAAWSERARATMPPSLAEQYPGFSFLWRSYRANFLFVNSACREEDFSAGLAELDALPIERFVAEAVQPLRGGGKPGEAQGVLDSPALRRRVLSYARARGVAVTRVVERLLEEPETVRCQLRRFLEDCWESFFEREWERIRPTLLAEVQARTDTVRLRGPFAAFEGLAPGVEVNPDEGLVVLDKLHDAEINVALTGLHLVPSAFAWPHVVVQDEPAWRVAVQYPLPGRRRAQRSPSLKVVQQRLEALADPVRLRLCRSIAREARSTKELADVHGMSPPAVSRHLKILRDAGLVTTRRHGQFVLYRLDVETAARLGPHLLDALLR